ncbi:MAG: VanZ family protein [Firmicutes bacterium]|nr:VanZ family protein [Bacillota bacterium]
MTKTRKTRPLSKYFYLGGFVFVTAVIFVFSLTNGADSSTQSNFFRDIVVNALNFFGVSLTLDQVEVVGLLIRKLIGHLGIFAVDGFFGYFTFYRFLKTNKNALYSLIYSLVAMFIIAFISEGMQFLVPDRGPALVDVGIDFSGAVLVIFILFFIKNRLIKKESTL